LELIERHDDAALRACREGLRQIERSLEEFEVVRLARELDRELEMFVSDLRRQFRAGSECLGVLHRARESGLILQKRVGEPFAETAERGRAEHVDVRGVRALLT